jgi:CheY-like chemotaxis protein
VNTDSNSSGSASAFNPSSFAGASSSALEELQALQKKYDALRQQYEGLNRLLEAQSKEFQATLQERDVVLDSNKTFSARVMELELRVQTLMREHRSSEELYKTIADQNQQLDSLTERLINEQEARKQAELALVQATDRLRRAQQAAQAAAAPAEAASDPEKSKPTGIVVATPSGELVANLAKPGTGVVSKALAKTLAAIASSMPKLEKSPNDPKLIEELFTLTRSVSEEIAQMGNLPLYQLATATRILLGDVSQKPALMVASRLRTLRQAIDLIGQLGQKENQNKLNALLAPNVLAVDDDGGVLEVVASELGELGAGVTSTNDPSQGLVALQNQQFNLILLDIGMSSHNGLELCARIRKMEDYARVPILFLTGLVAPALRDQAIAIGGDDFLAKPFHTAELGLKAIYWSIRGQLL